MEKSYTPISCSYYDRLEAFAVKRTLCVIVFKQPNHTNERTVEAKIVDVFSKGQEEFIRLDTSEEIRLDYLISINGILNPTGISCGTSA